MRGVVSSNHDDLHDSLRFQLERRTHNRLRDIEMWNTISGIEVTAKSATYYVVQLALTAVANFIDERTDISSARLLIDVNGQPLDLCLTNGAVCHTDGAICDKQQRHASGSERDEVSGNRNGRYWRQKHSSLIPGAPIQRLGRYEQLVTS